MRALHPGRYCTDAAAVIDEDVTAAEIAAYDDGLLAVSVPADPRTSRATGYFFQGSNPVGEVTVGALPDMVTYTPNGRTLVVANEGEPSFPTVPGGLPTIPATDARYSNPNGTGRIKITDGGS